ncbi:MAG: thioesterase family protein [Cyclobacteriaceae bacterium]
MYKYETKIRVRYAETDQMGFVYYGNYPAYYEVARVECLRNLGYSYKEMEASGIGMPVLDLAIKYAAPAKYDDLLTITVSIPEMPRARIKFLYEVTNDAGKLINTGETTLVFMNMVSGRPVKMPQIMHDLFKPYYD